MCIWCGFEVRYLCVCRFPLSLCLMVFKREVYEIMIEERKFFLMAVSYHQKYIRNL